MHMLFTNAGLHVTAKHVMEVAHNCWHVPKAVTPFWTTPPEACEESLFVHVAKHSADAQNQIYGIREAVELLLHAIHTIWANFSQIC